MEIKRAILFNGDTDGICSVRVFLGLSPNLHGTRFFTGAKREHRLLQQVPISVREVYAFDLSSESNRSEIESKVLAGIKITWFDHHHGLEIVSPKFKSIGSDQVQMNTSLAVFRSLKNKRDLPWTILGLLGDRMEEAAKKLLQEFSLALNLPELMPLAHAMNYNAYGISHQGLQWLPQDLLLTCLTYDSPLDLLPHPKVRSLIVNRSQDLEKAFRTIQEPYKGIYWLDDSDLGMRIHGELAYELLDRDQSPVLVGFKYSDDRIRLSIRVPQSFKKNVGAFCSQFETGGGRIKAGGITSLPLSDWEKLQASYLLWISGT